ncbi:nitrilase-related carbon-nitrogen hydrolase [Bellilinea sp.]|jgi:omega-amidase|uniref:nitrilase-related carbon-nitrogen hydrolase n=1 Tax=Bellilinea sp. TaxID=2838785 RepID=UPI002ADE0FCB|nr:nitrilase-related carbon-nitrogen hydrolase [Bellilinea sp.]
MNTKISLAQFEVQIGKPEQNFQTALGHIEQAASYGSSLILLPELWSSGYDLQNSRDYVDINQDIINRLKLLSRKFNIAIGGSYITCDEAGCHNTFLITLPDESVTSPYHKVHLFRLLDEHQYFKAGNQFVSVDFDWGKAGLAICYDLRFPELFRFYSKSGAFCILIVAQWGAKRAEHWRTFLKARAIENQLFIGAVNAIGMVGNNSLAGYSAVISPWGDVLVEGSPDKEELITAEMNFDLIEEVKQHLNSGQDRRDDLYKRWFNQFI